MDEEETKICSNCKRDIPVVNLLVHTVHCARNIKVCPTCKEPVPQAELKHHQDTQHVNKPCKACGESVCGSDLEDHLRDSCEHTVRPCRYCELELPRRELPLHEGYCGSRTEQCTDCAEWVMIKYRQLHLDSNHGFIKLDEEPPPLPRPAGFMRGPQQRAIHAARQSVRDGLGTSQNAALPKQNNQRQTKTPATTPILQSTSNGPSNSSKPFSRLPIVDPVIKSEFKFLKPVANTSNSNATNTAMSSVGTLNQISASSSSVRLSNPRPSSHINSVQNRQQSNLPKMPNGSSEKRASAVPSRPVSSASGLYVPPPKRTNDRPQVNTTVPDASKVKDESTSRGAIKKRPAPAPPSNPTRDLAFYSALSRHQDEERRRRELNAYNLANGLPPVLNPAEKLEKLRKMDALHNREVKDDSYKNRLQGRCWGSPVAEPAGNILGTRDFPENGAASGNGEPVERRNDLNNLTPMTQQQFLNRFQELQLRADNAEERMNREGRKGTNDRFSEIKSSLRELRRGLNEVTAPYNAPQLATSPRAAALPAQRLRTPSPPTAPVPLPQQLRATPPPVPVNEEEFEEGFHEDVCLPCEFCDRLVPADDLVQHQTGCRPDLTQYRPRQSRSRSRSPVAGAEEPVIPCEFCAEALPVYLIIDHQKRCGREGNLLFPD